MGCFHVSCGLSHCSIGSGERAGILPLIASDNLYDGTTEIRGGLVVAPHTHIITNDGSFTLYRIAAFPIWGKYNDYGELQDIVRDDNVLALEKFFGTSIEVIATVIARGVDDANPDELKKMDPEKLKLLTSLSGTWMAKDIYDGMAASMKLRPSSGDNEFKEARDYEKGLGKIIDKEMKFDFGMHIYNILGRKFYGKVFWIIYRDSLGTKRNWLDNAGDKFKSVYWMMYATNRMFLPVISGPQCGDYDCELKMNEIIGKRIKKSIRKWGRDG